MRIGTKDAVTTWTKSGLIMRFGLSVIDATVEYTLPMKKYDAARIDACVGRVVAAKRTPPCEEIRAVSPDATSPNPTEKLMPAPSRTKTTCRGSETVLRITLVNCLAGVGPTNLHIVNETVSPFLKPATE